MLVFQEPNEDKLNINNVNTTKNESDISWDCIILMDFSEFE